MIKKISTTFIAILLLILCSYSQSNTADSVRLKKKYWSIETSVIWPIYPGIYKLNFVREVWSKKTFYGEVGLSLNIQPERYDSNSGYFSEEFMSLFYRQYFWKGFHVQLETNFAYGRIKNWQTTGNNYESYAIFHDFTGGYQFELLKKNKVGLTISLRAGGGFTSYVNTSWPRSEKPYWLADVVIGMKF